MLVVCGIALTAVLFVPMWKIELQAPQYPEGLELKIYPHKLGGNVDIINGLNHYIGMKTLHTEDFIEFKILPYIIGFFALCCFLAAALNRKKWLIVLTTLFVLFGIVAMVDFWRWEYDYGHDLDPKAAIQVPGMAYQPPLIGYKKLLNFGAYSIPDTGGWIFVAVGIALVLSIILQIMAERKLKKSNKPVTSNTIATLSLLMLMLSSCTTGPQPIKVGIDSCVFCKMTIADKKFGGEIITKKNKVFKFDDIHCLISFKKDIKAEDIKAVYLIKYNSPNDFIEASKAFLLKSEELRSPMAGNVAAFDNEESLQTVSKKLSGSIVKWEEVK